MLGSPLPRTHRARTRSVGPGSTRNSVSNLYSGPSRARPAAAVTSFTFDAGFINASASLLNTTVPSSRLRSCTPSRASRKGARWARSRRVFFRASRSAAFDGAARAEPATRQVQTSAARQGRQGDKRAALRGERPMDGSSPALLHDRKVGRVLTRRVRPRSAGVVDGYTGADSAGVAGGGVRRGGRVVWSPRVGATGNAESPGSDPECTLDLGTGSRAGSAVRGGGNEVSGNEVSGTSTRALDRSSLAGTAQDALQAASARTARAGG